MIGSGIFLLPSSLAPFGILSLPGWVITTIGAILLAQVFAKLSHMIVGVGGPYAYTRVGFGDFAGFWVAWGYWISLWVGNAGLAVAFVGYLAAFFPVLNNSNLLAGAVAIIMVWVVTLINLRGADLAGKTQTVTTVIKLIPLAAIGIFGLFYFDSANPAQWTPTSAQPSAFSAVQAVVALTLWSFLGLESAATATDTVDNPTSTIPRATLVGTLIVAVVYIVSSTSILGILPASQLEKSTFPFADAAKILWGTSAFYFVAFCVAVSCFGALNGFTLCTPQVSMAAADDGLFPSQFSRRSKANVPAWGMVVSSILLTALLTINFSGLKNAVQIFNFTILLSTLTTLVPYAFCAMAELMIFFTNREQFEGQRLGASTVIAILAFIFSIYAIIGSGESAVFWGFILLIAGIPVYVWMRKGQLENSAAAPKG
jgi:APA family basic amino acid/polyamine antiporter